MKNLSKSMLAVLALCFVMAACGKKEAATETQDSVKTETTTVDSTTTTATDTTAVKADTTAAK